MSAHHQERPKKSFEFRMSKKVAELTQVVHMLFTRNHEKEVEIEALKKSYEHEIETVIEDAKSRIAKLDETIADMAKKSAINLEKLTTKKDMERSARESEWRQKVSGYEKSLQEERTECQNLRDMLINAQKDIEKLREGVADQLTTKSDELQRRDKEIEKLRTQTAALDTRLKEANKEAQLAMVELERGNEKMSSELRQLHGVLENSHKTRDQLLARNKQLENDMKALKRDVNRRVTEMVNSQTRSGKGLQNQDTNEELERLRREIQRYRLELSNRDNNFNRMFTEKQPMVISQRAGSGSGMQKLSPGAIFTQFSHTNGVPNLPQSAGNHQPPGSAQALPKERQGHRNSFEDKNIPSLERQMTMPEKSTAKDRLFTNVQHEKLASVMEGRPQTFMHERSLNNERNLLRQPKPSLLPDEPNSLLPQRHMSMTTGGHERPNSSSLPSICSTPEQRRMSKQLAKPKPLPREMLYGK